MEEVGACVVVTGELLGQRPNSQKRPQLDIVAREGGAARAVASSVVGQAATADDPRVRRLDRSRGVV